MNTKYSHRRPKIGLPDLLISYVRWMSLPAPRACRLGGWSPASTLCVTPLPRPAEWVAVRPLERRLFSLSGSPMSCIEGHRYAGLAFVQGSIALGSSAGVSPSRPAPPSRSLSIARARLVRRSSFAVFESPVTRDKTMCSGRPIKIVSARLSFLVLSISL